jgi:two-component sensor histidine kinase
MNDRLITLTVEDDGVGLPRGLDFRETETLGLQLVALPVQQMQGTIELKSAPGTLFSIRFPENRTGG